MNSFQSIIAPLTENSWLAIDDLFDDDLLRALSSELFEHELSGHMKLASVGRLELKALSKKRGDSTLWLDDDRCGAASKSFLLALDTLRINLNKTMMLGLESTEAHFAIYQEGMAYARHLDRFRDDDARVLSLVCYLNIDWPDDAGGAIRLHLADGLVDIAPRIGTSVIFLSGEIEHEVMASTQTRYSIAVWFHRREIQLR